MLSCPNVALFVPSRSLLTLFPVWPWPDFALHVPLSNGHNCGAESGHEFTPSVGKKCAHFVSPHSNRATSN